MKVLFAPHCSVEAASSRYRVYAYLPELARRKIPYEVFPFQPDEAERPGALARTRRTWDLVRLARGAEVLFLHRLVLPPTIVRVLERLGKKIVFDFDESLHVDVNGSAQGPQVLRRIENQIRKSSRVFVGNSYLRKFAGQWSRSVYVLPTGVDLNAYKPRESYGSRKEIVIGWLGTVSGSAACLHALETVFDALAERYKGRLKLLLAATEPVEVVTRLPASFQRWTLEGEQRLLETMDIGILPLLGNERDLGWSGFQLTQYMARGIPVVASAIGVNSDIVAHGHTGFLVNDEEEWRDHLAQLVDQEKLREFIGRNARRTVEKRFDFQKNCEFLVDQIEKVSRE